MELRFEQIVQVPRETLFRFHENPANLAQLLAELPGFRLLAHDGHIRPGAILRVEHCVGPIPVSMAFEHVLLEPPHRFGERLIHGPFREFVHTHSFEEVGGATRLIDELQIRMPLWLGGEFAAERFAKPRIAEIFDLRHRALAKLVQRGVVERCARAAELRA